MMPFAGGLEGLSNGTLVLSAVAAFLYLFMQAREASWRKTVVKTASIGLLALLAVMEGGPWLLVAGLVLSAAGDAALAQKGERAFMAGLASFLAAHLAYVVLFISSGGGAEILFVQPWRLVLPLLALPATVLLLMRLLPAVGPALRGPITLYVVVIFTMLVAAASVAAPIVLAGAALFLASDAILAVERFLLVPGSIHHRWTGPTVWLLYYLAQVAIMLGFLM